MVIKKLRAAGLVRGQGLGLGCNHRIGAMKSACARFRTLKFFTSPRSQLGSALLFVAGLLASCAIQAADPFQFAPVDSAAKTRPTVSNEQALFDYLEHLPEADRAIHAGRLIALEVNLDANPSFSRSKVNGRDEVRYRMAFNQITEGWNWYPLANPQHEDYYHAKFLPLATVPVSYGTGESSARATSNLPTRRGNWRWDYFLAFENLYDFYPRLADDDAGFSAMLPDGFAANTASEVKMLALARLRAPFVAESDTFWSATLSQPVDFMLKKRYLFADLLQVWFYDNGSGKVLAKVLPSGSRP